MKSTCYVYTVEAHPPDSVSWLDATTVFAHMAKYSARDFALDEMAKMHYLGWTYRIVTWKNGLEHRKEKVEWEASPAG